MKKTLLVLAVCLTAAYAQANGTKPESAAASASATSGGLEISGHSFVGAGWQRFKTPIGRGAGTSAVATDVNNTVPGVIGGYLNTSNTEVRLNRDDIFRFFVDEVEVDLAKTFGENIRFRADLDFGSATLYSGPRFANLGGASAVIEQAYATANVGVGNGLELLLGRFNAPIGFESVDVNDNSTISRTALYRSLRPHNLTGVKLYYAFSDSVDWQVWGANNSPSVDDGDVLGVSTDIPLAGMRLQYKWGDEGKQSHVGFSGLGLGQDHLERKSAWTFMGDMDFNWWATDNFAVGGEALYRQIDTIVARGRNSKYIGGLLNLHYDFSDVWDGTLKYGYTHDVNGIAEVLPITGGARQSLTGMDQQLHEVVLATNYSITDGAKLRLEGGYTLVSPTGFNNARHVFGFGGGFAYEF